jgi:hypothetical protein
MFTDVKGILSLKKEDTDDEVDSSGTVGGNKIHFEVAHFLHLIESNRADLIYSMDNSRVEFAVDGRRGG